MKVIILTSSRADYGIYKPFLQKLNEDSTFELSIVAFGTHLSDKFGMTVNQIEADGFNVNYKLQTLPTGDAAFEISESIGKTIIAFSSLWEKIKNETDLIFCLGDRYEMFAAIFAAIPFSIPIAHIHGGETTLGAIDNIYRHSLTHAATYHFASTLNHANRIIELKESNRHVYNVGALSLDNLKSLHLLSKQEFFDKFHIPVNDPLLVTFHPETVAFGNNELYVTELIRALTAIQGQIIITMPNADTSSNSIRTALAGFAKNREDVYTVESFGTQGYFSCLYFCRFVLGNSSSGIIEAASFGKYVINIGQRQKGRESGKNVLHCAIDAAKILELAATINELPSLSTENIYGDGNTAFKIISILKSDLAF